MLADLKTMTIPDEYLSSFEPLPTGVVQIGGVEELKCNRWLQRIGIKSNRPSQPNKAYICSEG